jgi:hypothetical protein
MSSQHLLCPILMTMPFISMTSTLTLTTGRNGNKVWTTLMLCPFTGLQAYAETNRHYMDNTELQHINLCDTRLSKQESNHAFSTPPTPSTASTQETKHFSNCITPSPTCTIRQTQSHNQYKRASQISINKMTHQELPFHHLRCIEH